MENIIPQKQIRAFYNSSTIRVYQAYSDEIADAALEYGTFISPPFKMTRMTWIKPSFLWMMYRCGWGEKDKKQKRILAIDITHEGFLWALTHSCLSSYETAFFTDKEKQIKDYPVRIQWDPERDIFLNRLPYRTIQIGLSKEAIHYYTNKWIVNISDITDLAREIKFAIDTKNLECNNKIIPIEREYHISDYLIQHLHMNE